MEAIKTPEQYKPVLNVVIYKTELDGKSYFRALSANLFECKGRVVSGAFMDMTEEDALALKKAFASMDGASLTGVLPERVLATNDNGLSWWTPAARRPLLLTSSLAEETGLTSGADYNWPPLLFASDRGSISVFVLKANQRPNETSRLGVPPFWNVAENGTICFGTARFETRCKAADFIDGVERAFFQSKFSHTTGSVARLKGMTMNEAWAKSKNAPFPVSQVIEGRVPTVGDYLNSKRF